MAKRDKKEPKYKRATTMSPISEPYYDRWLREKWVEMYDTGGYIGFDPPVIRPYVAETEGSHFVSPVFFDEYRPTTKAEPTLTEITDEESEKLYAKAMEERREGRIKAGVEALALGFPLTSSGWADALASPSTVRSIVMTILNAADDWEEGWD